MMHDNDARDAVLKLFDLALDRLEERRISLSWAVAALDYIAGLVEESAADVPTEHRGSLLKIKAAWHWDRLVGNPLMDLMLQGDLKAGQHVHVGLSADGGGRVIEFQVQE